MENAAMDAAVDMTNDESRAFEHLEVSRNGGERHRERLGELADGRRAAGEAGEDPSAGGVTEGAKNEVEARFDRRAPRAPMLGRRGRHPQ